MKSEISQEKPERETSEAVSVNPSKEVPPVSFSPQVSSDSSSDPKPEVSLLKRKKRSAFSINDTLNKSVKEEKEDSEDNSAIDPRLPKDEFSESQLSNIWNEYLEIVKSEGRQKIYSSLSNKDLKLKENFIVELQLENDIQEAFFNEEKTELIRFMREKLNNFSLQFEIKKIQGTKKLEPYSPQEKYKYMLEKNPHLALLKQKLDLDIE